MNDIRPTVQLSNPVEFPEQYAEACTSFLALYWQGRKWEMQEGFGFHQLPILMEDDLRRTMLAESLSMIAHAAAGDFDRENEMLVGEIYEHIQDLMEYLFAPPGLSMAYSIPNSFWESPLGSMVARAQVWLRGDELITLKEAAEIRGITIQAISQAVKAGRLTRYIDPDKPERQERTLVSRKEIEEMDK